MAQDQNLLFQLEKLLSWKKSKKFMAEKLQITEGEVEELLKELREKDSNVTEEVAEYISSTRKVNNEKGTLESTLVLDYEPKDDLELAALHKINLDKYVITNYWSKVLPSGKFTSSVFSKLKKAQDYTPEDFAKFLQEYKPKHSTVTFSSAGLDKKKIVDVEISLSDFHLAKKVIDGNNDIEVRKAAYMHVVQELVKNVCSVYDIGTVVFPISNDFFHTDNYQHATTNGTPQDTIVDYAQEYEHGFDLLVQAIDFLKANADNVEVILVQGNHDRTKSYYLAHALEVYYKNDDDVYFDRSSSLVKAVVLGSTFIGYHHGNCKIEDLPLLFATHKDYSQEFGNAVYREVHTGDKHHYMAKEVKGVRIQQMPSLSGTDRWHSDNNFVHSIRAGLALVYHHTHGKIAEFESRI
jgi:hypothetical protein